MSSIPAILNVLGGRAAAQSKFERNMYWSIFASYSFQHLGLMLDARFWILDNPKQTPCQISYRGSSIAYLIESWIMKLTAPQGPLFPIEISEKHRSLLLFSFHLFECSLAEFIGVNMPGIAFVRIFAFFDHKMTAFRPMRD